MCTAQVKRIHETTGRQVSVVGRHGKFMYSDVFENNPRIATQRQNGPILICGGGERPYIAGKTDTHWRWRKWDIAPGEIYLSAAEKEFAEPYRGAILIEPHTKVEGGNKAWHWHRWQAVVDAVPGRFLQVGLPGIRVLRGSDFVATTFRQAMAVLSVCRAFVGTEGALHHSAAALSVPAVTLWSEFIDPMFTGYATQRNIRHAVGWCGARLPCAGCRASMDAIQVDEVVQQLKEII